MTQELLRLLCKITPEEERLRRGSNEIEQNLYSSAKEEQGKIVRVDAAKLLEDGKLIQIRTHTRFVHFPVHTHNYVEMVYMCQGSTHHVINGVDVILNQGELLFISQSAKQEIYPAKEEDVAVNFIILPGFFDYGLTMMETENNQLRSFVISCLTGAKEDTGYLHFKVADVLPVQNLVENLIWTIVRKEPNKRSIQQAAYLLSTTQMNVMEIGLAVGYDNTSYFHRIFQKRYGKTPRTYRMENKK